MPRVLVTVDAGPAERAVVDAVLGDDAAWLMDGADGRDAEAVLCFLPRKELAAADMSWSDLPRLALVQVVTAGVNHVGWEDIPDAVTVAAAPGSSAPMVAEHVLAMLLWWSRRLGPHDRAIRAGRFDNGAPVRALGELKVGLVGFGGVGRAVARLLCRFDVCMRAVSKSGQAPDEDLDRLGSLHAMDGLPDLVEWADALVLCLPLVRDTQGLVDADVLARMDGERLLVNVARGPIVVEDDLYDWLAADPVHAAALVDPSSSRTISTIGWPRTRSMPPPSTSGGAIPRATASRSRSRSMDCPTSS